MKKQMNKYLTKELLDFVNLITCDDVENMDIGLISYSENKKYKFQLFTQTDEFKSVARVGIETGTIQIQKNLLTSSNHNDNIFFLMIWCGVQFECGNLEESDKIAIEYCLDLDMDRSQLFCNYCQALDLQRNSGNTKLDRFTKAKYIFDTYNITNTKSKIKKNAKAILKPPMGLIPKKIHDEQVKAKRFNEVCIAMVGYYRAGLKINMEWVEEYNELVETVKQQ
jgi:hypothetical protein